MHVAVFHESIDFEIVTSAWTIPIKGVAEFRLAIYYKQYHLTDLGPRLYVVAIQYPNLQYSNAFSRNWCSEVLAKRYYNDLIANAKIKYPEQFANLNPVEIDKEGQKEIAEFVKKGFIYKFEELF